MRFPFQRAALGGAAALLLVLSPPSVARQDAAADAQAAAVQAVIDRYDTAYREWVAKMRAASPAERGSIPPLEVDGFLGELTQLAEGTRGTEAAAKAWMKIVQLAPQGKDRALVGVAVDSILRDHATSAVTAGMPSYLSRGLEPDQAQPLLRRVAQEAPKGELRAGAMLELARSLGEADATTAGSPAEKELEGLVADLTQEYAELEDSRGRSYAALAEGILFSRKHVVVGQTVPEIEAADTQGVSFKLSDYRGKVVLLDFWGNW